MKNLKEWCIENNEYTILKLYENGNNQYKSDEIGFSSSRIVNFKCEKCKISWKQSLNKTTKKVNKGCPYCSHQRPSYMYNIETEVPELVKEWNYEKNYKNPSDYLPYSAKEVWWKCKNGHVWKRRICDSVSSLIEIHKNKRETTCPYCNHERISGTYNIVTEYPEIAREWNYIKNGSLTPLETSPKSNKKVWWICKYNPAHTWTDRISNRTILNRGCPICSKKFTISFPSRAIYFYLKKYLMTVKWNTKF